MALPASVKLPYFRDAAELPGPLPTPMEIRDTSTPELSPRRSAWGDSNGGGNALLFVEKHLHISAPRLYAMYRDSPNGPLYLVIEYIRGVNLESLWNSFSVEAKSSIAMQLRHMFE
ncbi:hypothetical protein F5X99DRAFT_409372 [Biscogniauxia marginata]|nr:hypothetical protein F5X99DRAFT_409372 [Biscogniauxia marginata]